MILLDTHVLVWLTMEPHKIGRIAAQRLRAETVKETIRLSPISAWEIAMVTNKGRLDVGQDVQRWLRRLLGKPGIGVAELTPQIAAEAGMLPAPFHGDPADRIIAATARMLQCELMTADGKLLAYAAAGHVEAIDARR